jgi:hypothetical protein
LSIAAQLPQTPASVLRNYSPKRLKELTTYLSDAEKGELEAILLDDLCSQPTSSFSSGPLLWLTSLTATENPKAAQQGLAFKAPFPKDTYFLEVFKAFLGIEPYTFPDPKAPRAFIHKSREMLTSWSMMAYAAWRAQWHQWEVIVQTETELKCKELIDYAAQLFRNQEPWLQQRHPLKTENTLEREFANGGKLTAIPSGEDKIRLYHPTLYVLDEAAFLPAAQACYDNGNPVAYQVVGISSAGNQSWFDIECDPASAQ